MIFFLISIVCAVELPPLMFSETAPKYSPQIQVPVGNFDWLRDHSKNCSSRLSHTNLIMSCEDGWTAFALMKTFMMQAESADNALLT